MKDTGGHLRQRRVERCLDRGDIEQLRALHDNWRQVHANSQSTLGPGLATGATATGGRGAPKDRQNGGRASRWLTSNAPPPPNSATAASSLARSASIVAAELDRKKGKLADPCQADVSSEPEKQNKTGNKRSFFFFQTRTKKIKRFGLF